MARIRKFLSVAAAGALALLVPACSATNGGSGHGGTVKFAILQNNGTPTANAVQKFAELADKYTQGKVKVKMYANSVLGSGDAELEGTEAGTIQFFSTAALDSAVPAIDALNLPYLFPSEQAAMRILNGPALQDALWSKFPAKGLRVLGVWAVGYGDILTTSKQVNTPGDLAGQRIRIFAPTVAGPMFSLVHADAVSITSGQVVTALSTHTIDGVDDPPSTLVGLNWYQSAKHLSLTKDTFVCDPIVVSEKYWKTLSSAEQKGIQKALAETLSSELAEASKADAEAVDTMKKAGVTVTEPATKAFDNAFRPVYQNLSAKYPQLVDALTAAAKSSS